MLVFPGRLAHRVALRPDRRLLSRGPRTSRPIRRLRFNRKGLKEDVSLLPMMLRVRLQLHDTYTTPSSPLYGASSCLLLCFSSSARWPLPPPFFFLLASLLLLPPALEVEEDVTFRLFDVLELRVFSLLVVSWGSEGLECALCRPPSSNSRASKAERSSSPLASLARSSMAYVPYRVFCGREEGGDVNNESAVLGLTRTNQGAFQSLT